MIDCDWITSDCRCESKSHKQFDLIVMGQFFTDQ